MDAFKSRLDGWIVQGRNQVKSGGNPLDVWLRVGPAEAAELQARSKGNVRKPRKSDVDVIARSAKAHDRPKTHQGMAFDWDGVMFDGHTRCEAIIQSGETIETRITFGLEPRAVQFTDDGTGRRLHQRLGENQNVVAAVRSFLKLYHSNKNATITEVDAAMSNLSKELELYGSTMARAASAFWGPVLMAHAINPNSVQSFVECAIGGGDRGTAAAKMHDVLLLRRSKTGKEKRDLTKLTLVALKHHLNGNNNVSTLIIRKDDSLMEWFRAKRLGAIQGRRS